MSMTAQAQAYRPLLTLPGESLLLARDAVGFTSRLLEFTEATGIPHGEVLFDPIVAMPLPMFPARFEGARRRWEGLRPEMMWHPLLWLPEILAGRFNVALDRGDGTVQDGIEPDDVWAVRVALELMESRLYDQESGMWLDVLALVGLDITEPRVVARVERWLEGDADEVLDAIDLSGYLMADEQLALREAAGNVSGLRRASNAAIALDLIEQLDASINANPDDANLLTAVHSLACLGSALNIGKGSPTPGQALRLWDGAAELCENALDGGEQVNRALLQTVANTLRTELVEVTKLHRAWLDALAE